MRAACLPCVFRVTSVPPPPLPLTSQVADAIRRNTLLGSSIIGIAAAYGLACGARKLEDIGFEEEWNRMCANMAATRPTAPDLFRCIEVMKREVSEHRGTHPALLERLTLRADELQSARMALDSAISDMGDEFIKTGVCPHLLTPQILGIQFHLIFTKCPCRWTTTYVGENLVARQHGRAGHRWIRHVARRNQVCKSKWQAGLNHYC